MDYSLGGNGQKSPSSEPHWRCLPPSGLVRAFTVIGGHIIERPVPAAPVASLAACHVTARKPCVPSLLSRRQVPVTIIWSYRAAGRQPHSS